MVPRSVVDGRVVAPVVPGRVAAVDLSFGVGRVPSGCLSVSLQPPLSYFCHVPSCLR